MLFCWRTFILLCFLSCDSAPEVPVCPDGVVKLRLKTLNPIKYCQLGYVGDGLDVGPPLIASVRSYNNVTIPNNTKRRVKFVGDLRKGRCWFDIEGYERKDLRISYMEEGKGQSKEDYKIFQSNNCTVQKNSSVEPPSEVPTSIPTTKATPRPHSNSTNSSTTLGPGRTTPTPEPDAIVLSVVLPMIAILFLFTICIKVKWLRKNAVQSEDVELDHQNETHHSISVTTMENTTEKELIVIGEPDPITADVIGYYTDKEPGVQNSL